MDDLYIILKYNEEKVRVPSLCKKYPEIKNYLQHRYPIYNSLVEVMYRILNNVETIPNCPVCGKQLPFVSMQVGYKTFCSTLCLNSKEGKKFCVDKLKNSVREKYGVDNIQLLKETQEKTLQTMLKKYGVKFPVLNECIRDKIKLTIKLRYGVEYVILNQSIKEKIRNTMEERYGVAHALLSNKFQDKFKETMKERYGVEYTGQSKELQEKMKQTSLIKYGVDNPIKNELIYNKVKQTVKEKYGVEYIGLSDIIKEKMKQNNLKKYGVEYILQIEDVKQKIRETFILKYGKDYTKYFIEKGKETKRKNKTFTTSKIETSLFNELKNVYNLIYQYSSDEYPFMCDFYLPDYDLYIEILGNWSHGKHPFDENNIDDINLLNNWKSKNTNYYKSAIDVWTYRDPLKRNTAKINNLNYIEIFSINLDECLQIINNYIFNQCTGYKCYC